MAVPGRRNDGPNCTKDLISVSGRKDKQSEGSDIDFDFFCDPCAEEEHRLEAFGFCSDCNHYLCKTCYTAHRRPVPMRNHKLLGRNEMPKTRPQPASDNNEVIEEKCELHVGKLVEFYCGNHDTIGCSVCMTLEHKSCDSVQYVPNMKIDNDQVVEIMKQLLALDSNARAIQSHVGKRVELTNDRFDNVQQEAKRFSKKTKGFIKSLEKDMEKTVQVERENEMEKLESTIDSLEINVQQTQSLSAEMTGYRSQNKEANLFIAMKKAEKYIECSSLKEHAGVSEIRNVDYVFTPNKELDSLQEKVECLGSVKPESRQMRAETPALKKVIVNCNAAFSVQTVDDTSECIIVGILDIIEPTRTVVADAGNSKIKVIKYYSNAVTTSLKLSSRPHAMAELGDSKICVTIPEEKKILFICVSKLFRKDMIKIVKTVACGFKCYGIATKDETIIVTCEYGDGRFAINSMNTDGQILSHSMCNGDEPLYIAVTNKNTYTLDPNQHLLKCLSKVDGSRKNERHIENATHFTATSNFLVVVAGLPQVVRLFDHHFQDIEAQWSVAEDEIKPVLVQSEYVHDFYVGCKEGRVYEAFTKTPTDTV